MNGSTDTGVVRQIILTTFVLDGALWTACVRPAAIGGVLRLELQFVRDWVRGGTASVAIPLDSDIDFFLARCSAPVVEAQLRDRLRDALARDRETADSQQATRGSGAVG